MGVYLLPCLVTWDFIFLFVIMYVYLCVYVYASICICVYVYVRHRHGRCPLELLICYSNGCFEWARVVLLFYCLFTWIIRNYLVEQTSHCGIGEHFRIKHSILIDIVYRSVNRCKCLYVYMFIYACSESRIVKYS